MGTSIVDTFLFICEHGLVSAYSASDRNAGRDYGHDWDAPRYSTCHRHFKKLEELGWITKYEISGGDRTTNLYGPTVWGIVQVSNDRKKMSRNIIRKMLKRWGKHEKFSEDYPQMWDTKLFENNPEKSIKDFLTLLDFYADIFKNQGMPQDLKLETGIVWFASNNPKRFYGYKTAYENSPHFRKVIDNTFNKFQSIYEKIKVKRDKTDPHEITTKLIEELGPMYNKRELDYHTKHIPNYELQYTVEYPILLDRPSDDIVELGKKPNKCTIREHIREIPVSGYDSPIRHDNDFVELYFDSVLNYHGQLIFKSAKGPLSKKIAKYMISSLAHSTAYATMFSVIPERTPSGNFVSLRFFLDPKRDEGPKANEFYDEFEIFAPNLQNAPTDETERDMWINQQEKVAEKIWAERRKKYQKNVDDFSD